MLLRCLLHVVPIIKLEHDEINNIIVMSRLLYYLGTISSLNKKLSWNGFVEKMSLAIVGRVGFDV